MTNLYRVEGYHVVNGSVHECVDVLEAYTAEDAVTQFKVQNDHVSDGSGKALLVVKSVKPCGEVVRP